MRGAYVVPFLVSVIISGCRGDDLANRDKNGGDGDEPDTSGVLFDMSVVRRFDVTIPTDNGPPSSWNLIDSDWESPGCVAYSRPYHLGGLNAEGQSFSGAGVKIKGGCGSSRPLDEKPSLKIHLSWDEDPEDTTCPEERRLYSMERITLNNGVQDWSALHEHLSYQFYRMVGVTAPRSAAAVVYINDEYYGIYQHIETIDRHFLARHFDTSRGKGMMYEGSYHCDLLTGDDIAATDGTCWEREFDLDTCSGDPDPEDDLQFNDERTAAEDPWRLLREFKQAIEAIADPDDYYPAITEIVAWDEFVAGWAASSILWDWDNYAQFQNNFRIYHDPGTDKWHYLPWGTDQTWIAEQVGDDPRIRFGIFDPTGDLARLCLEATGVDVSGRTCTEVYVAELYRQLDLFDAYDWIGTIDAWEELLDPYMQEDDPHRSYGYGEWQDRVERIREFADRRVEVVRSELDDEGFPAP